MLSGAWALFGFNSFSNFSTPFTVIWIGALWGSVLVREVGGLVRFSLVNADWNKVGKICYLMKIKYNSCQIGETLFW